MWRENTHDIAVGIDIGSTTAKIVCGGDGQIVLNESKAFFKGAGEATAELLAGAKEYLEDGNFPWLFSGSSFLGRQSGSGSFCTEVFARAEYVRETACRGCAIERGGEDAKILFFKKILRR